MRSPISFQTTVCRLPKSFIVISFIFSFIVVVSNYCISTNEIVSNLFFVYRYGIDIDSDIYIRYPSLTCTRRSIPFPRLRASSQIFNVALLFFIFVFGISGCFGFLPWLTPRVAGGDRDAPYASGPARSIRLEALPSGGREQPRGGVIVGHLLDSVSYHTIL